MNKESEEIARKLLASLGAQPHDINKALREAQEHETHSGEILRYAQEIMGLDGDNLVWAMARAFHGSFKVLDGQPQRDVKIKLLIKTHNDAVKKQALSKLTHEERVVLGV